MKKRTFYLTFVIFLQFALLFGLVGWYSLPFWSDEAVEVTVRTVPVDPRDYFRGDYVILNYPFSQLQDESLKYKQVVGQRVYTILKPVAGTHLWEMEKQTFDFPGRNQKNAGSVAIRGLVSTHSWRWGQSIKYGIEQFFLQEGTGRAIEEAMRDRKGQNSVEVTLRVMPSGRTVVKGVKVVGPEREAEIEFMPTEVY